MAGAAVAESAAVAEAAVTGSSDRGSSDRGSSDRGSIGRGSSGSGSSGRGSSGRDSSVLENITAAVTYYKSVLQQFAKAVRYTSKLQVTTIFLQDSDNSELIMISRLDRVRQTPADKTGNELDFNAKRRKSTLTKKTRMVFDKPFFKKNEVERDN